MKPLALSKVIINTLFFLALSSCAATRVVGTSSETHEQVRVIEHTELVPVRVEVPIPEIRESVVVRDSSSHLENEYAVSDASVDRNGFLHHSLATKPQTITGRSEVPVQHKDSIVTLTIEVEKIVEVPVEKKLTRWQSLKMRLGGFSFGLLLVLLIAFAVSRIKFCNR